MIKDDNCMHVLVENSLRTASSRTYSFILFIKLWSPAKHETFFVLSWEMFYSSTARSEIVPRKKKNIYFLLTWGHDLTGDFYSLSLITKPALLKHLIFFWLQEFVVG